MIRVLNHMINYVIGPTRELKIEVMMIGTVMRVDECMVEIAK